MKEENKKEVKKGILTGIGTTAGTIIGAVVENTINASDIEAKDLSEAEVVAVEDKVLPEPSDEEQNSGNEEPVTSAIETPSVPSFSRPSVKPVSNSSEPSVEDSSTDGATEVEIAADECIEAVVETAVEVESESDEDIEDIMVVSIEADATEDYETDDLNANGVDNISDELTINIDEAPDYMDMKDNVLPVSNANINATDMPDYINDANIDSFIEND